MDDYYCVEEFSDNEVIDSSDDEDFKSLFTCIDSEEEEDFETEMERERQSNVNGIHKSVPTIVSNRSKSDTNGEESDSESNTTKNDELFYDPKSDENDQKWVDSHRPKSSKSGSDLKVRSINSDATLNCSACMALLCLDCQRHEIYRTQYRAMFVTNCRIDFTQKLQYKQKQKKRKRNQTKDQFNCVDNYFAVFCKECNTQVAVYDTDQVYHFFGVLASF